MKYWFMRTLIRNGERTYNSLSLHKQKEFDANNYISDFYGGGGEELDEGVYEFNCGSLIVSVGDCREITKEEYETLKRFINEEC